MNIALNEKFFGFILKWQAEADVWKLNGSCIELLYPNCMIFKAEWVRVATSAIWKNGTAGQTRFNRDTKEGVGKWEGGIPLPI